MKKIIRIPIITIILFISLISSVCALNLSDIDTDSLQEVLKIEDNSEEFIDGLALYPGYMAVKQTSKGSTFFYTEKNDGTEWLKIDLFLEFPEFKANGLFVFEGIYYIYGSTNQVPTLLSSTNLDYWVKQDPKFLEEFSKGSICKVLCEKYTMTIYIENEDKSYAIKTNAVFSSYTSNETNIKIPEDIVYYKGYFMFCDEKKVYQSIDGYTFSSRDLEYLTDMPVDEILDYRFKKTNCSMSSLVVVYSSNKKLFEIQIYAPNDGEVKFVTGKINPVDSKIKSLPYMSTVSTTWGWPILIVNTDSVKIGFIDKNAKRIDCEKSETSWAYQYSTPNTWAFEYVDHMAERGVLSPRTISLSYSDFVTRENYAEYIYWMLESFTVMPEVTKTFKDTKDAHINSLYELGILNGDNNGNYRPKDLLTREEAFTILNHALCILVPNDQNLENKFNDSTLISKWAEESINNLYFQKIISGDNNGNFNPQNKLSIEEALIGISRVFDIFVSYSKL